MGDFWQRLELDFQCRPGDARHHRDSFHGANPILSSGSCSEDSRTKMIITFAWSDPRGVAGHTEAQASAWPYTNRSPTDP
jgi:hypothetical protein